MSLRPARRMDGIERTLIRRLLDGAPPDAINLGLGQPDLPTPAEISLAGVDGIVRGRTGYTTTAGDPALRRAVAERYRPFAGGAESVVIHVGSQEALFAASLALVDPGDEVLFPDPGYPAYPAVARLASAIPVSYPLRPERAFRIDPRDVEEQLTRRTRAVIVCSPGNPTGAVHGPEELEALARLLERRRIAWISDEIYASFVYEGTLPSLCRFSTGGLVISGLSKALSMTGWRIGWVVGPREILRRINAAHQYLVTCAPSISQVAALAAFTPGGQRAEERYRSIFKRRRARMAEELSRIPGVRFHLPDGAFYFFVDVGEFGGGLELSRKILDRKQVITIPGSAFGRNAERFLRISFAASEDHIVRGIRAIAEVLHDN